MCNVSGLHILNDRLTLEWKCGNTSYERRFTSPIVAVPLKNGSGIVVVEPGASDVEMNAIILGPKGEIKKCIVNPEIAKGAICFGDVYYVGNDLTLFIMFNSSQMGCVINEEGEILRLYESR